MSAERRRLLAAAFAAPSLLLIPAAGRVAAASEAELPARMLDVPYVPTPMAVVDAMLDLAEVKSTDRVYDLGCGDGRIVIRAAERFGARGVGVDLDPQRVKEARANARKAGRRIESLVRFVEGDVFFFDFSSATVVTMYLLPSVNLRLRPRLLKELKPGTRIVSHDFNLGAWTPERRLQVDASTVYRWTVPADPPAHLLTPG
jgi:SAM-dependent methyltransferase